MFHCGTMINKKTFSTLKYRNKFTKQSFFKSASGVSENEDRKSCYIISTENVLRGNNVRSYSYH